MGHISSLGALGSSCHFEVFTLLLVALLLASQGCTDLLGSELQANFKSREHICLIIHNVYIYIYIRLGP